MFLPRLFAGSPQARTAPQDRVLRAKAEAPRLVMHTDVTELVWCSPALSEVVDRLKSGAARRNRPFVLTVADRRTRWA